MTQSEFHHTCITGCLVSCQICGDVERCGGGVPGPAAGQLVRADPAQLVPARPPAPRPGGALIALPGRREYAVSSGPGLGLVTGDRGWRDSVGARVKV